MRTLACLGTLALFLAARSALAAPSADTPADSGKSDSASAGQTDGASDKKAPDADGKSSETEQSPTYGHGRQFGLRLGIAGGYNMIFRYDRSPFCAKPKPNKLAKDQQKFCGHAAPFALDVALSFAPLDSIEPFIWGRFGLSREPDTDTDPVIILGAGARIYTMSDSAFKVFIEPAVGAELEGGGTKENWQASYATYKPEYNRDIVFHVAAGPQYDFAKNVGIYLDAGLTVGILRSIHTTMELVGGAQARFP